MFDSTHQDEPILFCRRDQKLFEIVASAIKSIMLTRFLEQISNLIYLNGKP